MKKVKRACRAIAAVLTACAVILASAPGAFASGNAWYDKYLDFDNSMGGTIYNSNRSGDLAWGESYVQRSYLDLYEMTGSTAWLDKFILHTDTVLSNANDDDGDGYQGWDTYQYSPIEIDNTGFETANSGDSTLPDKWTRFQANSQTAYRSSTIKYSENYGAVVKTNGTLWQCLYQPFKNYEPSTKYTLRLYAKTNGSAAKGKAYVRDMTNNTVLATIIIDTTTWTEFTAEFTTPSVTGHNLQIWLTHQDYKVLNGEADFDDVKISARFPSLIHDAMIGQPIAEFVRLVNKVAGLQSAYLTKANTYKSFLENNIVPRWQNSSYIGNCWVNSSSTEGYYVLPPNFDTSGVGSAGITAPYNFDTAFARMLMIMYDVNSNSDYLDKINKIANYFKNRLQANGTAYKWCYSPRSSGMEDTSHGMIDISFALELFRHNSMVFNGTDMEKFADALTGYMWNGSTTAPVVTKYVDGTGDDIYTKRISGWEELSQFDWDIWQIGAEQYRNLTPNEFYQFLVMSEIMLWDPEKVVNQGFELYTSFDSTQPARWVRLLSNASTAYLDSTNKASGDYGLTIKANGTSDLGMYQTWKQWKPSTTYVLTFDGKTDGTAAGGKVFVKNETTGQILATCNFTNTSWETKTLTFTTPANSTDTLRIHVRNNNYTVTNGKAHFDNLKVKVSGDSW